MTIQFNWSIIQLESEISDGFVSVIHYQLSASDGTNEANLRNSINLERPEDLIPYNLLTEHQVIEWLKNKLGQERIMQYEDNLTAQLEDLKTPAKMFGTPWSNARINHGQT